VSEFEEGRTEAISDEQVSETSAVEAVTADSNVEAEPFDEIGDARDSDASDVDAEVEAQDSGADTEDTAVTTQIDEGDRPTASLDELDDIDVQSPDEPQTEEYVEIVETIKPEAKVKPKAKAEVEDVLEDEAQPAEEPDDGRRWYVVHCYSGYENKVRHNLEQRIETMEMKLKIFDVVVPTEEEIEVKDGKRRTVERRVFPGYILVQMLMDEDSWYVVRNTPGVTGFVGMGNDPTPLRPEEVSSIVKRMEAEAPRIKVTYKIDQKVRIVDGPFNDFIGTVADIDMERAKVRVMVSFFGRETPVELDFLQVEKA